jgi:transposase
VFISQKPVKGIVLLLADLILLVAGVLDSVPQIMALENLPRSTIRSIIDRFEERGCVKYYNKPQPGPKPKTTNRDNSALRRAPNKDIRATLHALEIPSKSTKQLGRNLICKILKRAGKSKRRPRKKPFLKPEHNKGRVLWCK